MLLGLASASAVWESCAALGIDKQQASIAMPAGVRRKPEWWQKPRTRFIVSPNKRAPPALTRGCWQSCCWLWSGLSVRPNRAFVTRKPGTNQASV